MNKWISALVFVLFLFLFITFISVFFINSNDVTSDSIVVVPLYGVISSSEDSSIFQGSSSISSINTVKKIKELNDNKFVKGVIFEIDSPGGEVVASEEIAEAVKSLNKPKYAVIRSTGASGGYWIASATDKIYASKMSITGSIGVIGSYLEFSGLMEKYGIGYERFVGGVYKDLGSPFKQSTDSEELLYQGKIDKIYDYFVHQVAENRKMNVDEIKKIATGEFYLGIEAKDLNLIDEFGGREEAVNAMKIQLNSSNIEVVETKKQTSFFELLSGLGAYNFGRGFAYEITKLESQNKYSFNV